MRRIITGLAIAACTVAIGARAQTPDQASPADTKAPSGKIMTLTGCLANGTNAQSFVLTEVGSDPMSSTAEPNTSQPNPTKSGEPAKTKWTLTNDGSIDLSKYVGHKVQVSGSAGSTARLSMPSATEPSPVGTSGQTDTTASQKLNVTVVKDISPTCTP